MDVIVIVVAVIISISIIISIIIGLKIGHVGDVATRGGVGSERAVEGAVAGGQADGRVAAVVVVVVVVVVHSSCDEVGNGRRGRGVVDVVQVDYGSIGEH